MQVFAGCGSWRCIGRLGVLLDTAVADEGFPVLTVEMLVCATAHCITSDASCCNCHSVGIASRYVNCASILEDSMTQPHCELLTSLNSTMLAKLMDSLFRIESIFCQIIRALFESEVTFRHNKMVVLRDASSADIGVPKTRITNLFHGTNTTITMPYSDISRPNRCELNSTAVAPALVTDNIRAGHWTAHSRQQEYSSTRLLFIAGVLLPLRKKPHHNAYEKTSSFVILFLC